MVRVTFGLAATTLVLMAQPALAQHDFRRIETTTISGATIEQYERFDPRDLEPTEDGGFVPKPNARLLRAERRCRLDGPTAQRVANALRHGRRASEKWDGLGADMVIRFDGGDEDYDGLVAVIEGFGEQNGAGEMRFYFAAEHGWLAKRDQAVIARVAARAGCPLSGHAL